ncbi:squalene synthase HpnC [Phytohabitans kaempferiae]|uniref:Squalene synthase HpnC n=1 Tax=Phytohabitans kaempferiae TaxID=1620943 RepID=A0ABV6M4S1_9ACTN
MPDTSPPAFAAARPVLPWRDPEEVRERENFPVALRLLPGSVRRHLLALYAYARYVDDLGDEPVAAAGPTAVRQRLAALDEVEAALVELYAGRPVHHPVVRALAPTVTACGLPQDALRRLIEANRIDQTTTHYATYDDLTRYCVMSANPVGELVLNVFGLATPERVALSDRICTALQVIEHLQDVVEDHRRGRVYLSREDMARFAVTAEDLGRPAATPAVRALVRFTAGRARDELEAGAPLVSTLSGWARLAVGGYLAGGRAALVAFARAGYDPLTGPVKAGRWLVATRWPAALAGRRR